MISNLAANVSNLEMNSLRYWVLVAANFTDEKYTNLVPALALHNTEWNKYLPDSLSKIENLYVDLENLPSIKYEELTALRLLTISGDFSGDKGKYLNSVPKQINNIVIENGTKTDGDLDFSEVNAKGIAIFSTHITGGVIPPKSLESLGIMPSSNIGNLSRLAECNKLTNLIIMNSRICGDVIAPPSLTSLNIFYGVIDGCLDISKCDGDARSKFHIARTNLNIKEK
jgi:hypothetical protein